MKTRKDIFKGVKIKRVVLNSSVGDIFCLSRTVGVCEIESYLCFDFKLMRHSLTPLREEFKNVAIMIQREYVKRYSLYQETCLS